MHVVLAYVVATAIFSSLDFVYCATIGSRVHRAILGDMMVSELKIVPTVLFLLLYPMGLVYFAILHAREDGAVRTALVRGGAFGLMTYATYGLTNLATLKHWTSGLVLFDVTYGAVMAALTAGLTYVLVANWQSRGSA